jgi:hypothetical protein
MIMKDSKGNEYIQIDVSEHGKDENIRITRVEEGYNGEPCLRFQIRDSKRLRPGPEVPIQYGYSIIEAISSLSKK